MEIYAFDRDYVRVDIVEGFESMIWTDRHRGAGDFELVFDKSNRSAYSKLFKQGYLESSFTDSVMVIDDLIEDDDEGTMTIKGSSIESLLNLRVVAIPKDATPIEILDFIKYFMNLLIEGTYTARDRSTAQYPIALPPSWTPNPPSSETLQPANRNGTLYSMLLNLANDFQYNFRLMKKDSTGPWPHVFELSFVKGSDKTLRGLLHDSDPSFPRQSAVLFDERLGNLSNTSSLESDKDYRNIAYVASAGEVYFVTRRGDTRDLLGLDRRVLFVDGDDLNLSDYPSSQRRGIIDTRGREALSKHNRVALIDGIVDANGPYKYGEHFNLGDAITIGRGSRLRAERYPERGYEPAIQRDMRVTEYIWSADQNGFTSYPTFEEVIIEE